MKAFKTFSFAVTVLALGTVASAAASRQEAGGGDARPEQITSFRSQYNTLMDRYELVFQKLGNARGLRVTAQGRESVRAMSDDQLAKMFQRIAVPDLRQAVKAAELLAAVTPSRGSATSRAMETPGFPNAPPVLGQCDNISHNSEFTFGALVALQVARGILAAAEFACEETLVVAGEGGNTAGLCIPLAIAQDAAAIPFELADFCGGEEDSALAQGSYDRLAHIHDDIAEAKAAIIANDNANRDIILTAMKNLTCDIERLLHTPEGQRKSEISECKGQPFFPYDFPIHP